MNHLFSIHTQFRCNLYGEAMTDALRVLHKTGICQDGQLGTQQGKCLQSGSEQAIKRSKKAEKSLTSA